MPRYRPACAGRPAPAAVPLIVDQLQRSVERFLIFTGVVLLTGERGVGELVRRDEVDPPHLGRIEPASSAMSPSTVPDRRWPPGVRAPGTHHSPHVLCRPLRRHSPDSEPRTVRSTSPRCTTRGPAPWDRPRSRAKRARAVLDATFADRPRPRTRPTGCGRGW